MNRRGHTYDAIVVGARIAGASTAMLLARKGFDVLLVDRARFPSEVPRGHYIRKHGPPRLARWGLLDRVVATGSPPITSITMDFGDFPLTGTNLEPGGVPVGVAPRRAALDKVLVDAAVGSGAELREHFPVSGLIVDGDRVIGVRGPGGLAERAKMVIGADGRNSSVAKWVRARAYREAPTLTCWYFSYWSGVPAAGLEVDLSDHRVIFAFPTADDLFAIFVGWPIDDLPAVRADTEGELTAVIDRVPRLAERVRAGQREERIFGAAQLPNFLRKPYGPGWALVGDAGAHKDPFAALGVCDALRDAELLAEALGQSLAGVRSEADALADYERRRNEATLPDYDANIRSAKFTPPPPELLARRAAARGDAGASTDFYLSWEGRLPSS
jgi:flavin-dependent dehydrogenase